MPLDPTEVQSRLRHAAQMFRFMSASRARAAMEGRLESDGALTRESFAVAVAKRLTVLRALNRRRDALRNAQPPSDLSLR